MPVRFLLSTASLYLQSLEQTFQLTHTVGFDGLELSLTPASVRVDPVLLRDLAEAWDLVLASVHPPTIPLPGWGRSPATFERLARLARSIPDCQIVVLHTPDVYRENDPQFLRFHRTLEILQKVLQGSSVRVALENRNLRPGEPIGPLDHPEALLAFSQRQACQIVLDTAHASTLPIPLLETYAIVRQRLANIHLSDVVPGGWWTRFSYPRSIFSHHRPPGQGVLPLRALVHQLVSDRYDGLLTLELSPVALRFWNRSATHYILSQALLTCRQWMQSPA